MNEFLIFSLFFLEFSFAEKSIPILSASELNCDFTTGIPCRWRNSPDPDADVNWIVTDRVAVDIFHSVPRGPMGLGDEFVAVRGPAKLNESRAILLSDPIPCQSDGGKNSIEILVFYLRYLGFNFCPHFLYNGSSK